MMKSEKDYPIPKWCYGELPDRSDILRHAKKAKSGAELGVFRGLFSKTILDSLDLDEFFMVDGWDIMFGDTFPDWGGYSEYTCQGTLPTKVAMRESRQRTSSYKGIRKIVRAKTLTFLNGLDHQLDFFYIDATHSRKAVLKELETISRNDLLAKGGFIMGDDWKPDPKSPHYGVMLAVNDFVKKSPFQIVEANARTHQWAISHAA